MERREHELVVSEVEGGDVPSSVNTTGFPEVLPIVQMDGEYVQ